MSSRSPKAPAKTVNEPRRSPKRPAKTTPPSSKHAVPARRGRPPKEDRAQVTSTTLTVRLTTVERDGIDRLVARRQKAASALGAIISPASLLRAMILKAINEEGESGRTAPIANKKTVPAPAPAPGSLVPKAKARPKKTVISVAPKAPQERRSRRASANAEVKIERRGGRPLLAAEHHFEKVLALLRGSPSGLAAGELMASAGLTQRLFISTIRSLKGRRAVRMEGTRRTARYFAA